MRRILQCAATLVLATLTCQLATAQTSDMPVSIGIFGGISEYGGEINGHTLWDFDNPDMNIHVGGEVGFYVNESFDFLINLHGGSAGDSSDVTGEAFFGKYTAGNFLVKYKLANGYMIKEDATVKPYIHFGGGFGDYKHEDDRNVNDIVKNTYGHTSFGFGLMVPLSDRLNFDLKNNYSYTSSDAIEGNSALDKDLNDYFMTLTGGLSYGLGKVVDTDGDGISDKKDACPTVMGLEQFAGCPDSDADGIPNSKDGCPNAAGTADMGGCPDSDGDGVVDKDDKCPNKAGTAAMMGCPDSDGDGIADSEDACPNKAGDSAMGGCPDTDGDGIADNVDACPKVKGTEKLKGCPDADGDGVGDAQDKCPNEAGIAANNGCPGVSAEAEAVFAQALRGIQFESSKDIIKGESYNILTNVVKVMKDNPSYKLFIQGHTDSQGDDGFNQKLSEDRAAAVKQWLVNKGVSSSRMRTAGFGETVPVADNGTAAGRKQNRRVEFKVEF